MSNNRFGRLASSAFMALGLRSRKCKAQKSSEAARTICTKVEEPKVLKEGWLFKRSQLIKTWSRRYFVLLDDGSLLGFRAKPEPGHYSGALNKFNVRDSQVMCQERPRQFTFVIRGLRKTQHIERTFSGRSNRERVKWVKAIELVTRNIKKKIGDASTAKKIISVKAVDAPSSKLSLDDFELMKVLGRGSFGKVVLTKEKSSNHLYAIKMVKKKAGRRSAAEAYSSEVVESRVLRQMDHPFIVKLKYAFQTVDRLCFAMEYVSGGELLFHLSREGAFSEQRTRFYAAEITLGLEYLHYRGIIYRDLKLENLLLDGDGHVKLADFGVCKEGMSYGETTRTFCGSPAYMAPEIVNGGEYGRAVDWWCLGVAIYQMMSGELPFSTRNRKILFDSITEREVKFPPTFTAVAQSLLMGLLAKNPEKRLGGGKRDAKDIKGHDFFRSIAWKKLLAKELAPPFTPELAFESDTRYFEKEFTEASAQLTPVNARRSRVFSSRANEIDQFYIPDFSYYGSPAVFLEKYE